MSANTFLPHLIWQSLPRCGNRLWLKLAEEWPDWPRPLLDPPAALLKQLPRDAAAILSSRGLTGVAAPWQAEHDRVQSWLSASDRHQLLCFEDDEYPPLLKQIDDAPPLLYVLGDAAALNHPQLAIVGSRHASHQGIGNARQFAKDIASQGLAVTSGLALGIDTAAHEGALAGNGITLAVLGTGVDVLYPARNRSLAAQITEQGGALVSEFPLGTTPQRSLFPKRNRLISGLSVGTIVVEAALQSGSLSTARHGMSQNRAVFAIPGSIHNPLSRGCHALIREGATLLESTEQIAQEVTSLLAFHYQYSQYAMPRQPQRAEHVIAAEPVSTAGREDVFKAVAPEPLLVAGHLSPKTGEGNCGFAKKSVPAHPLWQVLDDLPRPPDQLAELANLAIEEVLGQLLQWELEGRVVLEPGGYSRFVG